VCWQDQDWTRTDGRPDKRVNAVIDQLRRSDVRRAASQTSLRLPVPWTRCNRAFYLTPIAAPLAFYSSSTMTLQQRKNTLAGDGNAPNGDGVNGDALPVGKKSLKSRASPSSDDASKRSSWLARELEYRRNMLPGMDNVWLLLMGGRNNVFAPTWCVIRAVPFLPRADAPRSEACRRSRSPTR
jgi:hypothetical protein